MKIKIRELNQYYGKKQVLHNVNLTIASGMFGLLGRNGAGKSTLMKTLVTLLPVKEGNVTINGVDSKQSKEIRSMIGYLPQDFSMYGNMTVYEAMDYLGILAEIEKKTRKNRIEELLMQVNLDVHRNIKVKNMSGGMKRRLGIAQALLNDPQVLVVDEPTAGLDPEERLRFRNLLTEISEDKIVLLSTHIAGDIEATAEKLAILDQGKIIFAGRLETLLAVAEEHIYTVELSREEAAAFKKRVKVISIQQEGMKTHLRFIADKEKVEQESPFIKRVSPTLEDAYLYALETNGGV